MLESVAEELLVEEVTVFVVLDEAESRLEPVVDELVEELPETEDVLELDTVDVMLE